MKNYLLYFFVITSFFITNDLYSQQVSGDKIVLVRSILNGKGIDEVNLLNKLKDKGVDIELLTEKEILDNKSIIEETIAEIEAEKNANSDEILPIKESFDHSEIDPISEVQTDYIAEQNMKRR